MAGGLPGLQEEPRSHGRGGPRSPAPMRVCAGPVRPPPLPSDTQADSSTLTGDSCLSFQTLCPWWLRFARKDTEGPGFLDGPWALGGLLKP